jgi:hypothetical protein
MAAFSFSDYRYYKWSGVSYVTNYDETTRSPKPEKPVPYAKEYAWAVNHPTNKDAQEFLNLSWGGDLDRKKAEELSFRILKRMIEEKSK